VYPERLETAAIDDVRRTKVRLEEYIRQRGKELIEVKRGAVASATSSSPSSCCRSSTAAATPRSEVPTRSPRCDLLADEGYVAESDAVALAEAYRFLRQLEHRLQDRA
jgi:glutamine synthetase adenylyltransferase